MDGDDFLIFMAPKVSFKSYQHLFPSLARRFACCQSCSVSAPFGLTALTALRRVLLKNRRLYKECSRRLQFSPKIYRGFWVLTNCQPYISQLPPKPIVTWFSSIITGTRLFPLECLSISSSFSRSCKTLIYTT